MEKESVDEAARDGNERKVLCLLKRQANPNYKDELLLEAARDGNERKVLYLLTRRANPNYSDEVGRTPLHWAARNYYTNIVLALIQYDANYNEKDEWGRTPLDLAVQEGNHKVVDILIKCKDKSGVTPLHCAAREGDARLVSTLITKYGTHFYGQDKWGNTPLHYAVLDGWINVVSVLATLKECINAKNKEGRTPLYMAILGRNEKVVEMLIQRGANIDDKDESGSTLLHRAAIESNTSVVSTLIQYGADIKEKNKWGSTPLHCAARQGNINIVSILIGHGADFKEEDKWGATPLHCAASEGHTNIVSALIKYGANPKKKDKWGNTPLHCAALNKRTDVVSVLINLGGDINIKNKERETALFLLAKAFNETELHSAVRFGIVSAVLQCLQKGDTVNNNNSQGQTPLHLAAVFGSETITVALLKYGALLDEKDIFGKTAYDIAEETNQTEVVRIFKKIFSSGLPKELIYLSTNDASTFTSNLRAGFYLSFKGKVVTVGHEAVGKTAITAVLIGKTPSKVRKPTDCIDLHIYRAAVNMDTWEWETKGLDSEDIAFRDLLNPPTAMLSNLDDLDKEDDEPDEEEENAEKEEREVDTDTDEEENKDVNNEPRQPQDADLKHKTESLERQQIKSKIQWLKMKLGMEKAEIRTIEDIRRESIKRGKKGLLSRFLAAINMMDFGGQAAFYSTHQAFLTYRGIYLLVIDGSRDFDDVIETESFIPGSHEKPTGREFTFFWVWSIISNSKGRSDEFPKIVPVCTHRDKIPHYAADKRMNTIYGEIQKMFEGTPAIKHLVLDERMFLNAMDPTDPGYTKLKEVLVKLMRAQPSWGEKLPKSWIYLQLCLQRAVEKGDFVMSMESMRRINYENPVEVLTEKELQLFLKMQHCQGELIHFPLPTLRDHIVISPKFLIDVLRSLITEKSFCKGAQLEALKSLNENGILMKKDTGVIWKSKLKHNEGYFYSLFEHLDILATPRKYNQSGGLMKSDKYYVPSLIRVVDKTDYLQDRFESRSISASFKFANNVMPPAVGYRLIASCIDMYEVLRYGDQLMLFSGMVVVKVKKNLDLVVILKSGRVNFSLVHSSSRFEIVRDTADGVLECLRDTLTNILESYRVTASEGNIKHDLQFFEEFPCGDETSPCYGECKTDWTCSHGHNVTKEVRNRWIVDRKTETCVTDCEGVRDCDLSEKLTELHLAKLSMQFDYEDLRKLVICLGLKSRDIERIEHDFPRNLQNIKFVCLRTWQQKCCATVGDLIQAIKDCELNVHAACQMRRDKPIPKMKVEMAEEPTDRVLDAISNEVIANSLLLSVELGLKAAFWIDLMHHRNISDINREVLEKWRKEKPGKGGIKELSQALCNVDVNLEALLSDL